MRQARPHGHRPVAVAFTPAAADFVQHHLPSHSAAGNNRSGSAITVTASGLERVYASAAPAALYVVRGGTSVAGPVETTQTAPGHPWPCPA